MKSQRKFYKTVVQVEVLSEGCLIREGESLASIARMISEGDWSGKVKIVKTKELNGAQAAKTLFDHGNKPALFLLTPSGADLK